MPSNITEKEDIFSKQRNTDRMRDNVVIGRALSP